tara:strand:- start:66 stop:998 length:933 start_codon:yes stop_codon:yes gene_type:complete
MKETKLRQLISEEIRFLLSERFGSKRLQSIVSGMSKWEKRSFLKAGVKTGLDWNTLSDSDLKIVNKTPAQLYGKQGIYLILASQDFDFRESGRYGWTQSIKKGQMIGMMVGGKVAYITKNGLGPKSRYTDKVGIDKKGARSVKGMSEMPHVVFEIKYLQKKGALKAKQSQRATMKFGATAFKTDKEFKAENLKRYKEALANSADKSEKIHKQVLAAVKYSNDLVEKAVKTNQTTKYGQMGVEVGGKIHELQYVTNLQNRILDNYARYTDYDRQSKEKGYSGEYYAEQRAQYALKIKQQVGYMLKNQFNKY